MFDKYEKKITDRAEIKNFFSDLKGNGYEPSTVSMYQPMAGYNILIVLNGIPDFYITETNVHIADTTNDTEINFDICSHSPIVDWGIEANGDVAEVTFSNNNFSATIDFIKSYK